MYRLPCPLILLPHAAAYTHHLADLSDGLFAGPIEIGVSNISDWQVSNYIGFTHRCFVNNALLTRM
jgi:hypothetical protein